MGIYQYFCYQQSEVSVRYVLARCIATTDSVSESGKNTAWLCIIFGYSRNVKANLVDIFVLSK